jgi:hypothetical protein
MPALPSALEGSPVHPLPLITASAARLGLVRPSNELVPPARAGDGGTIVLGLVGETRSGRSPLDRLEEFCAHQDTAVLWGTALPPQALSADTVGRALDRLDDLGTRKMFTACAVRAATQWG